MTGCLHVSQARSQDEETATGFALLFVECTAALIQYDVELRYSPANARFAVQCTLYKLTNRWRYCNLQIAIIKYRIYFDIVYNEILRFINLFACIPDAARGSGVLVEVSFSLIPLNQEVWGQGKKKNSNYIFLIITK